MGLVVGRFHEFLGMEPLAHQPPLHVDHANEHRVDRPFSNLFLEGAERQSVGHSHLHA